MKLFEVCIYWIGIYQCCKWIYKIGKAIVRNKPKQPTRARNEFYDLVD
jgi:hypothetical protein